MTQENQIGWASIRSNFRPKGDGYRVRYSSKLEARAHSLWRPDRRPHARRNASEQVARSSAFAVRPDQFRRPGNRKPASHRTLGKTRPQRHQQRVPATQIGEQAVGRAEFLFGAARPTTLDVDSPHQPAVAA